MRLGIWLLPFLFSVWAHMEPLDGDDGGNGSSGECALPCTPDQGQKGYPGVKGQKGEVGEPGARGRLGKFPSSFHWHVSRHPGADGKPGQDGENGEVGVAGEKGLKGMNGTTGRDGSFGSNGIEGMKGEPGDPGPTGVNGSNGPAGGIGDIGLPGLQGDPGSPGDVISGEKGDAGEPGTPGSNGTKGNMGDAGSQGPSGPQGEPGPLPQNGSVVFVSGDPGPSGPAGDKGDVGDIGEAGDQGEQGSNITAMAGVLGGPCNETNEGEIHYESQTGEIIFCDGSQWQCANTEPCCEDTITYKMDIDLSLARSAADVLLIVDDSGSMAAEQDWISFAANALEQALVNIGIGRGEKKNHFFVVIFGRVIHEGDWLQNRTLFVNISNDRSAKSVEKATVFFTKRGNAEDGFDAIEKALSIPELRKEKDVALNVALITDEPRDPCTRYHGEDPPGTTSTRERVAEQLLERDAKLNLFADMHITSDQIEDVIAVDYRGVVYGENAGDLVDSNGFQNISVSIDFKPNYISCKTFVDYGMLAMETLGAIWNLNKIDETTANKDLRERFTEAVARIKVTEIATICVQCNTSCQSNNTVCARAPDQLFCICKTEEKSDEDCRNRTRDFAIVLDETHPLHTSLFDYSSLYQSCTDKGFPNVYNGWFDPEWPNDGKRCFPPPALTPLVPSLPPPPTDS